MNKQEDERRRLAWRIIGLDLFSRTLTSGHVFQSVGGTLHSAGKALNKRYKPTPPEAVSTSTLKGMSVRRYPHHVLKRGNRRVRVHFNDCRGCRPGNIMRSTNSSISQLSGRDKIPVGSLFRTPVADVTSRARYVPRMNLQYTVVMYANL